MRLTRGNSLHLPPATIRIRQTSAQRYSKKINSPPLSRIIRSFRKKKRVLTLRLTPSKSNKFYSKRDFKACDDQKAAVYLSVNEDFEAECNAEITLLGNLFEK